MIIHKSDHSELHLRVNVCTCLPRSLHWRRGQDLRKRSEQKNRWKMVNPDEAVSAALSNSTAPQAQAPLSAQQSITVTNRHLNITSFVMDRDPTNTANRWDKWRKYIERQFRFFGTHEPELKKDRLIMYGGHDIADLKDSLPDVESTDPPADEYTQFI